MHQISLTNTLNHSEGKTKKILVKQDPWSILTCMPESRGEKPKAGRRVNNN